MKFFKRTDVIIIAAAAAVCVLFAVFFTGIFGGGAAPGRTYAEIYYRSELVRTIDLQAAREGDFSLPQLPQVVFRVYPNHSIAFVKSDCPDQVCVHAGKLSHPGQLGACLPNQVLVKIVSAGDSGDEPDIVIR